MLNKKNILLWKVASRHKEETPEEYSIPSELLELQVQLGYDREEYVQMIEEQRKGYIPDKSVPPELLASAQELGWNITVETFPAEGFTQRFQAATQQNRQPDILAFVEYSILDERLNCQGAEFGGLNTIDGVSESLIFVANSFRSLVPSSGGWQVIILNPVRKYYLSVM